MTKALAVLAIAGALCCALLACDPDPTPSIPVRITDVDPAAGSTLAADTPFAVTIEYTIPAMESSIDYRISALFAVQGGGGAGGETSARLTQQSGTITLNFSFSPSAFIDYVYPYELSARLYESHTDYEYTIENSSVIKFN